MYIKLTNSKVAYINKNKTKIVKQNNTIEINHVRITFKKHQKLFYELNNKRNQYRKTILHHQNQP
ncbi:hypothetical protein HanRHA438_Chr10g0473201 [Helianthus annuus]|nr:hypothetical protein HanRHA438_Chr10g0473201 [Helianthus annuus]